MEKEHGLNGEHSGNLAVLPNMRQAVDSQAAQQGKCQGNPLHQAVLEAAHAAGGQYGEKGLVSYLEAQALKAPSPFLTLLGKVLGQASDKEPQKVTRIELVAPALEFGDSANRPERDMS